MSEEKLEATDRTALKRFPERGHFDKATIHSILDHAPLAHLAFANPEPAMLPMAFWRVEDHVYFHGFARNRMFQAIAKGSPVCFVATILDAFVAARAALHHSVNYRSVVIYGRAEDVTERGAKLDALKALIERYYPGRWAKIRPPSLGEFNMVRVFRLPIAEASAKIRTGFPTPYEEDFGIPVWAGVIPVEGSVGAPQIDPNCAPGTPVEDFSTLMTLMRAGRPG